MRTVKPFDNGDPELGEASGPTEALFDFKNIYSIAAGRFKRF
jgi:hypothetical protein